MFDMRTGSGNSPLVIETLIRLISSPTRHKGITIEDGELYVTHDTILTFFREEIAPNTRTNVTSNHISNVLRGLVKTEGSLSRVMQSRMELGRVHWRHLDCKVLLEVAEREGMTSVKLRDLVAEQDARAAGQVVEKPIVITTSNTGIAPNVLSFGTEVFNSVKGVDKNQA